MINVEVGATVSPERFKRTSQNDGAARVSGLIHQPEGRSAGERCRASEAGCPAPVLIPAFDGFLSDNIQGPNLTLLRITSSNNTLEHIHPARPDRTYSSAPAVRARFPGQAQALLTEELITSI